MFSQLLQIFNEFERQEKLFNSRPEILNSLPTDNPQQTAFENFKRAMDEHNEEMDKKKRFAEFLNRRRDLLETLTQSVIDSSGKAIQATVEKALDDEARKMTDKMVYWYFK